MDHRLNSVSIARYSGFVLIALLVFLSRWLTRGPVYFVDGPRLVEAIRNHTYVIQAPGYWLFARTAAMFPDPAFGLVFVNECCSALGAAFLFVVGIELGLRNHLALLAALASASVFFVWFAGDVHSSYATQFFFPVLSAWLMIRYRKNRNLWLLLAGSACMAVGTGMRPSDGAFLLPLFAVFLFRCARPRWHLTLGASVYVLICLAWYIPTRLAVSLANQTVAGQMVPVAEGSSLLFGAGFIDALENATRLLFPLAVAFWMLVPVWISERSRSVNLLLGLWIAPGFLFFLLVHIANPAYLVFATPALIMLAALSKRSRLATISLLVCVVWNTGFFLAARPIRSRGKAAIPLNYYAIMYTNYAVHRAWMHRVSDNAPIP